MDSSHKNRTKSNGGGLQMIIVRLNTFTVLSVINKLLSKKADYKTPINGNV